MKTKYINFILTYQFKIILSYLVQYSGFLLNDRYYYKIGYNFFIL